MFTSRLPHVDRLTSLPDSPVESRRQGRLAALHRILIVLVFSTALSPIIPWVDFSGGMENFNVATAIESQRDNHWLMPYLGLEPRTAKPPLVHWITAAGISMFPQSLAWGARGISILVSCALLLALYELGRTIRDEFLALVSALVCGTTILFLKFAWQASYDLHLALWVTVANWCLALALFKGRRWEGGAGAGIAIGLALMVKGPVAILQTVVPWLAFIAWRRWKWKERSNTPWAAPAILAALLAVAIALPWTLYAFWFNRHMMGTIFNEVSLGTEASYETRIRWHSYIVFFPMMIPWLIWFLTGFVEIVRRRRELPGLWLAIFWLVLPIFVMTFFPERRDRYLLPMVGPAAMIAAFGVLRHVPKWGEWIPLQKILLIAHGATLAVLAIGLPIWGATELFTVEGSHWYSPTLAAGAAGLGVVIFVVAMIFYRRSRGGFIGGTVALMLLINLIFMWGYKDSTSGRSAGKVLAADILSRYPDALVFNAAPDRRKLLPLELLVYLNRDVPELTDVNTLPPATKPQVLVVVSGDNDPPSGPPAPPGFTKFAQERINSGVFYAFVREAR